MPDDQLMKIKLMAHRLLKYTMIQGFKTKNLHAEMFEQFNILFFSMNLILHKIMILIRYISTRNFSDNYVM